MSAMAKDILEQIITRGMTEAEMVRAVYDFLTLNLTYTNEKYQNGNSYPYASYTLERLLNRVGVCEGISVTFLYLLRQLQIECFGYASETHAWNVVKLGDQHFFCDVTWDLRERENGRRYQYYMLKGWVYIADGAELTIEPGTVIKGDKDTKAALIVERGGKLFAKGTADVSRRRVCLPVKTNSSSPLPMTLPS